jgi:hypothetical protein
MFAKQNAVFNYISTGYINFLEFLSCTERSVLQSQTASLKHGYCSPEAFEAKQALSKVSMKVGQDHF